MSLTSPPELFPCNTATIYETVNDISTADTTCDPSLTKLTSVAHAGLLHVVDRNLCVSPSDQLCETGVSCISKSAGCRLVCINMTIVDLVTFHSNKYLTVEGVKIGSGI